MDQTQLEWIKTELKHAIYEINKKQGPRCAYLFISRAGMEDVEGT
jgi:hypothetical protein